MRREDDLTSQLPALEGPVAPDPAFAARLRDRFLAESGHRPQPQSTAVPIRTLPVATRPPRKRLLDLAAVAVLLLSMVGGIARVSTGGDPTPTIQAPETAQPAVMLGGTAARDNRYEGPIPKSGRYKLRLDTDPDERAFHGPGYVYEGVGFVLTSSMSGPFETTLDVFDLETGTEIWTRYLVLEGTVAITPDGVVATIPIDDTSTPESGIPGEVPTSQPYRVALLELESGEVIWKSTEGYGGNGEAAYPTVVVDGQRIFLSDNLGTLAALDLASGNEIWRQALDRTPSGDLDQEICPAGLEPPGDCWRRSSEPPLLAVKNGSVYFADPVSGRITALSADDGAERWSVFIPDRIPGLTLTPWVVAFDDGLAVQLFDPEAGTPSYLGFWRAEDGTEAWSIEPRLGGVASDGQSLFISSASADRSCCQLSRIDAQTGDVIQSANIADGQVAAYLSTGSVVLETITQGSSETPPSVTTLIGLDPQTLAETWRVTLPERGCGFPAFPVPDPEHIVCFGFGTTGLRIFEWSSPPASPVASQPEPTALPFERGDTLVTTADGVALRAEPDLDAEIVERIPEAGSQLVFIGEAVTGSDGAVWYRVRSNETALTGYIRADLLAPEE
jgi:outer membrane protein assembly factor BamB